MHASSERTLYLHAGTHKTATTSIQVFLAANEALLAGGGILVPRTGRPSWDASRCGHHNVAWELNGIAAYDPAAGTFAELLEEIARSGASTAIVSSEEFEYLHAKPEALRALAEAVRGAGFTPKAIFFLRAQAEYVQAIYAEGAKAGFLPGCDYERLLRVVLEAGTYSPHPAMPLAFEYGRLLAPFADAFGPGNVLVREYRAGPLDAILRRFLGVVAAGGAPLGNYQAPPPLNVSPTLEEVLVGIYASVVARDPRALAPGAIARAVAGGDLAFAGEKFDVMTRAEAERIAARFARDNALVERDYGVRVAPATVLARDGPSTLAAQRQRALLGAALDAWGIAPAPSGLQG